jgi:hypothetical protein
LPIGFRAEHQEQHAFWTSLEYGNFTAPFQKYVMSAPLGMWLGKHNEASSYLGTFAETGRLLGFILWVQNVLFLFAIKVCHLLYPYVMKFAKVYSC